MSRRERRDLASRIFIAVIAVILILGISLPMILSLIPDKVTVPDLEDLGLGDAKALAEKSGLTLKVVPASSPGYEPGQVVSQKPAAGERVAAGTTVEVEVSR